MIEPRKDDDDIPLARIRQGDRDTWHELYSQHCDSVERLIAHITRLGPAEVDDLAQETWTKAFEKRSRCEKAFQPWLLRIAYTVAIDTMRRTQRWRMESIDEEPGFSDELADGSTMGRFAEALEARELLSSAFGRMRPEQVALLYLVLEEELSLRKAAAVLQVSSSDAAMSQRLARAIAAFHRALGRGPKDEK